MVNGNRQWPETKPISKGYSSLGRKAGCVPRIGPIRTNSKTVAWELGEESISPSRPWVMSMWHWQSAALCCQEPLSSCIWSLTWLLPLYSHKHSCIPNFTVKSSHALRTPSLFQGSICLQGTWVAKSTNPAYCAFPMPNATNYHWFIQFQVSG